MVVFLTLCLFAFAAEKALKYGPAKIGYELPFFVPSFWRLLLAFCILNFLGPVVLALVSPVFGAALGVCGALLGLVFTAALSLLSLLFLLLLLVAPVVLFSPKASTAFDLLLEQVRRWAASVWDVVKRNVKKASPECPGCVLFIKNMNLEEMRQNFASQEKFREYFELVKVKGANLVAYVKAEGMPSALSTMQVYRVFVADKAETAVARVKAFANWAQELGSLGVCAYVLETVENMQKERKEVRAREVQTALSQEMESVSAAEKKKDECAAEGARRRAGLLSEQLKADSRVEDKNLDKAAAAKKKPISAVEYVVAVIKMSATIVAEAAQHRLTSTLMEMCEVVRRSTEKMKLAATTDAVAVTLPATKSGDSKAAPKARDETVQTQTQTEAPKVAAQKRFETVQTQTQTEAPKVAAKKRFETVQTQTMTEAPKVASKAPVETVQTQTETEASKVASKASVETMQTQTGTCKPTAVETQTESCKGIAVETQTKTFGVESAETPIAHRSEDAGVAVTPVKPRAIGAPATPSTVAPMEGRERKFSFDANAAKFEPDARTQQAAKVLPPPAKPSETKNGPHQATSFNVAPMEGRERKFSADCYAAQLEANARRQRGRTRTLSVDGHAASPQAAKVLPPPAKSRGTDQVTPSIASPVEDRERKFSGDGRAAKVEPDQAVAAPVRNMQYQ